MLINNNTHKLKDLVLKHMESKYYRPSRLGRLATIFEKEGFKFKDIRRATSILEAENSIIKNKMGDFVVLKVLKTGTGKISIHKKGFGFITPDLEDENNSSDYFVASDFAKGAYNGDRVEYQTFVSFYQKDKIDARVIAITERANNIVVGLVYKKEGQVILQSDDNKFMPQFKILNPEKVVDGNKVTCEIIKYLENGTVQVKIKEVLGHKNDPGVDILSQIYRHNIRMQFNDATMADATELAQEPKAENQPKSRRDLTKEILVTIDGKDSKDLDDAVSIIKLDNGNFELGVHIADVSHYVTEDSNLDKEALKRGNSTYLVDRVVPMLPAILSNGICSLNPSVIRLTISCKMEIDSKGKIVNYDIFPAFIKTTKRLNYDDVNAIFNKTASEETLTDHKKVLPTLKLALELSNILTKKRHDNGTLDFDLQEAKIKVDKFGNPVEIKAYPRDKAEQLIENLMVSANETIAHAINVKKLPFIYRIHEKPTPQKIIDFVKMVKFFGINTKTLSQKPTSGELQDLVDNFPEGPIAHIVKILLLRTMQKAKYSEKPVGHYGLALKDYTHFTSPIRRYSDLIVHRLLRKYLFEGNDNIDKAEELRKIHAIATQISECEVKSVECERAVNDMKKAQYFEQFVGKKFKGIIASVNSFGFFVEINSLFDGLVHSTKLTDDDYEFMPNSLQLIGLNTKRTFSLGQIIEVVVAGADRAEGKIDLELTEMTINPNLKKNRAFNSPKSTNNKKPSGIKLISAAPKTDIKTDPKTDK